MQRVLITGGSGLIGTHLTRLLLANSFEVAHLSRHSKHTSLIKVFEWDPSKHWIDENAFDHVDHIIHLAGASVANYWTRSYKKKLLASRTQTAELIFETLSKKENRVKTFISASATGFYGDKGDQWLNEDSSSGNDYLAEVCQAWESSAKRFETLDKRVVILRTGIVLAKDGGTLPALMRPLHFGIAPIFGNGKQFYSWIHIDDLCDMYLHSLNNHGMTGIYNAVNVEPARFKELIDAIAKTISKRKLNVPVHPLFLNFFLDGFGASLLNSARCSAEKIIKSGFSFQFARLDEALKNLAGK